VALEEEAGAEEEVDEGSLDEVDEAALEVEHALEGEFDLEVVVLPLDLCGGLQTFGRDAFELPPLHTLSDFLDDDEEHLTVSPPSQ
jgi:hypothetical protein